MMMIMMITEIDVETVVSVVSTWQLRPLIAVIIVIHQSPLSHVSARATDTVCAAANWKIPLLLGLLEEAHFINTPDKIYAATCHMWSSSLFRAAKVTVPVCVSLLSSFPYWFDFRRRTEVFYVVT